MIASEDPESVGQSAIKRFLKSSREIDQLKEGMVEDQDQPADQTATNRLRRASSVVPGLDWGNLASSLARRADAEEDDESGEESED